VVEELDNEVWDRVKQHVLTRVIRDKTFVKTKIQVGSIADSVYSKSSNARKCILLISLYCLK